VGKRPRAQEEKGKGMVEWGRVGAQGRQLGIRNWERGACANGAK